MGSGVRGAALFEPQRPNAGDDQSNKSGTFPQSMVTGSRISMPFNHAGVRWISSLPFAYSGLQVLKHATTVADGRWALQCPSPSWK